MRNAYALLGLSFLIVFGGAYVLFERAHAPTASELSLEVNHANDMQLTSTVFKDGGLIPAEYTCDGDNLNPPLQIAGVPEEAVMLVLVMDDPDIPDEIKETKGIEKYDHWVVYNIPDDTLMIPRGATIGELGLNSSGAPGYAGPCPPPDMEPYEHRYIFRLYAVSEPLDFSEPPTLGEVEAAAQAHSLGTATLTGVYRRREG